MGKKCFHQWVWMKAQGMTRVTCTRCRSVAHSWVSEPGDQERVKASLAAYRRRDELVR